MNMNEVIARINELAHKAKAGPLTDEELAMIDREYPAPTKKVPLEKI